MSPSTVACWRTLRPPPLETRCHPSYGILVDSGGRRGTHVFSDKFFRVSEPYELSLEAVVELCCELSQDL